MAEDSTPQWQLTRTSRQGFGLGGLVVFLSWLLGGAGAPLAARVEPRPAYARARAS